jgi:RecA-family ATPase
MTTHNIGAMADLQTLARALGGEINNGQVLAPGPGHSPQDRSLSVKLEPNAPDGFLVHSFSTDDAIACRDFVREKLGLQPFKPNGNSRQRVSDDEIARAVMAAAMGQNHNNKRGSIVATYDYLDADGVLLYQVLRYEPKNFRQRRPDGNGGWTWKLDERRVLYRWPELLEFPDASVFVCEGEKDADNVAALGHCATCVAAGKWTNDCIKALAGRDVVVLEDNDDAGRVKALTAAQTLHGTAKTIRIVSLPGLPDKGDVSDWLDADPHRAKEFCDVCIDVPVWEPSQDSNTPETASTESKSETAETPALPFINIAAWQDQPVPDREWTVKDRIPAANVTLLSGEGAIGKSILALQLGTATVLGRDWLSVMPEPGPALIACCEDDERELWRRLDLIAQHYGAAFTKFRDMHLMALAGQETLMAVPDRHGLIQPTKLFAHISQAARDIRPKLIVLDNAADIYGGNENDRAQVRQFIGLLRGMAIASGAGVLLTSHPSLTGISTGTGLSGSTAWNASVRSRLYFKRATTDKDEEPDPDLRVLECMKSNYGPVGETIQLRWKDGLFLPVAGLSNLEKLAARQAAGHLFLELLGQFNQQGRNTSAKPAAPTYAPTLFAKEKGARELGIKKTAFEDAMRDLFAADKIGLERYGPKCRDTWRLAPK